PITLCYWICPAVRYKNNLSAPSSLTVIIFYPPSHDDCFYDQLEIKGPLITPLLLNIMYAHAAKHTSHSSKPFYTRARQLVDDFIDTPRISTVMALLYLAAFDDGTWSSRCWMYSGMAVRMALDLGLYKANYYSNEMSQFDVELRKRVLLDVLCHGSTLQYTDGTASNVSN
ncbi:hypothetical protein BC941DRAFT_482897, partial [Chlamydoabsidia padenii]